MREGERVLAGFAAAIAARDRAALHRSVDAACRACPVGEVEEMLLQSHLFVGFPLALEAVAVWRERSGIAAAAGQEPEGAMAHAARGEEICLTVYGGQYERLRANVKKLHPLYERWMLEDGYGKVLGRPGLTLRVRELCIVAQLAVLGAPRQLYSHLRGARNAGADDDDIETVLAEAATVSLPSRAQEAWSIWVGVQARGREG